MTEYMETNVTVINSCVALFPSKRRATNDWEFLPVRSGYFVPVAINTA